MAEVLKTELKKGKIIICDEKGNPQESVSFSFNPSSYYIYTQPNYKNMQNLMQDTEQQEFLGGVIRTLQTRLIFDSFSDSELFSAKDMESVRNLTEGVENRLKPVTDKLKKLEQAVHVSGQQHRPPLVIFSWGNLNFKGFITNYNTEYTMFSMEGKPIRATVQLSIIESKDPALASKENPFESPDRTKSRVVVEGMSLWSIAYEEYDDCEKWRIIAKANHIMDPLDVRPGQVIRIPALDMNRGQDRNGNG